MAVLLTENWWKDDDDDDSLEYWMGSGEDEDDVEPEPDQFIDWDTLTVEIQC